eukprot:COSAG02_NODE_5138_length_4595_cov_7.217749_1_plen_191_part_00
MTRMCCPCSSPPHRCLMSTWTCTNLMFRAAKERQQHQHSSSRASGDEGAGRTGNVHDVRVGGNLESADIYAHQAAGSDGDVQGRDLQSVSRKLSYSLARAEPTRDEQTHGWVIPGAQWDGLLDTARAAAHACGVRDLVGHVLHGEVCFGWHQAHGIRRYTPADSVRRRTRRPDWHGKQERGDKPSAAYHC